MKHHTFPSAVVAFCLVLPALTGAQDKTPTRPPGQQQPSATPNPAERSSPPSDTAKKPAPHEAPAPTSEAEFIQAAAKGGMKEVKLAELGVSKGSDPIVKQFSQLLVKDHTAANAELKKVAKELKIDLSGKNDPEAEAAYAELKGKKGGDFDTAFLQEMDMCHEKSVALFQEGKKLAKADTLVAFIDKTLPVIQSHAAKIKELSQGRNAQSSDAAPGGQEGKGAPAPAGSQPQPGTNRR